MTHEQFNDSFCILPAIDLKEGHCVRLRQGRADQTTVYSDDPVEMARYWEANGARCLHLVDLDGAFQGHPVHMEVITNIVKNISIPVEVGGGLRTDADIEQILNCGAARVILGTRAWSQCQALPKLVARFGHSLAVGIDARGGFVQVKGWTETTSQPAVELAKLVAAAGVRWLIYTDTAQDGMLSGPNIRSIAAVCRAVNINVIASGGIASTEDVLRLRAQKLPNLRGVVVGKALYEEKTTIKELLAAADEKMEQA